MAGMFEQETRGLSKHGMRERFLAAIQSADALISIGRFTTEGFLQLGADAAKIHIVPNGVDLAPLQQIVNRPVELDPSIQPGQYVLFLGRLSARKGLDVLLKAIALLPAAGAIELVIAGSGDAKASLEQQIEALNLKQRVRLVGRVGGDGKIWLLQNAICLAVPSRGWEAFPLVVLEAYAAGRPVVGSRIAGLEDVIANGETGLLVEPESETDLANALRRLREDANLSERMGATARLRAADYGWDRIAERHLELYRALAK